MSQKRLYVLNMNIGGVGRQGEIVEADPQLWAVLIEAGMMAEIDEHGDRLPLDDDELAGEREHADEAANAADVALAGDEV